CLHTERDETALSRCVGSAADHEGPTADVGCRETSPTWVLDTVRRWGRTGSATIPRRWGRLLRGVVETVFGFMEGGAQNTSCQDATRATSKMRGGHPGGPPRGGPLRPTPRCRRRVHRATPGRWPHRPGPETVVGELGGLAAVEVLLDLGVVGVVEVERTDGLERGVGVDLVAVGHRAAEVLRHVQPTVRGVVRVVEALVVLADLRHGDTEVVLVGHESVDQVL